MTTSNDPKVGTLRAVVRIVVKLHRALPLDALPLTIDELTEIHSHLRRVLEIVSRHRNPHPKAEEPQ